MTNRSQAIIPFIISKNQTGFVKGRSISENIVLAHEFICRVFESKSGRDFCLNLDLKKAFDKVKWGFIKRMLQAFNFPDLWN